MQTLYWPTTAVEHREDTQTFHRGSIERVIQHMRTHLQDSLSIDEFAEIACLSPYYFSRVFHSLIGLPPGEYLSSLRLQAAKKLLLETSLSVTDICFDVGYYGLGSFTSRFTQQVGLSPRRLRFLVQECFQFEPTTDGIGLPRPSHVHTTRLTGYIRSHEPLNGLILVGLFPKPIPQGRPVRCTSLFTPGSFCLEDVPPGKYYLMVAAFPLSDHPQTYLLPEQNVLSVGSFGPVVVSAGGEYSGVEVWLRPLQVTDPPLLAAVPYI